MRALSLWQPWASLMALALKRVETRGSNMAWRGPLAIHATATWQAAVIRFMNSAEGEFIRRLLEGAGVANWKLLPLGSVLCTVDVVDCRPTEELYWELSEQEIALGDYHTGRFGIVTAHLHVFTDPIPARGAQGIWNWEAPS